MAQTPISGKKLGWPTLRDRGPGPTPSRGVALPPSPPPRQCDPESSSRPRTESSRQGLSLGSQCQEHSGRGLNQCLIQLLVSNIRREPALSPSGPRGAFRQTLWCHGWSRTPAGQQSPVEDGAGGRGGSKMMLRALPEQRFQPHEGLGGLMSLPPSSGAANTGSGVALSAEACDTPPTPPRQGPVVDEENCRGKHSGGVTCEESWRRGQAVLQWIRTLSAGKFMQHFALKIHSRCFSPLLWKTFFCSIRAEARCLPGPLDWRDALQDASRGSYVPPDVSS